MGTLEQEATEWASRASNAAEQKSRAALKLQATPQRWEHLLGVLPANDLSGLSLVFPFFRTGTRKLPRICAAA